MLFQRNKLIADFDKETPSLIIGAVIEVEDEGKMVPIVHVYWSELNHSCYFSAVKDNFQTYIVDPDLFADFVYMLDELYYKISKEHGVSI